MSAADRFLEQNVLQLAVDDVAEDDITCIICYDAYNSDKRPVRVQPCGHIFCLNCLTTHVQGRQPSSHTCPLCRGQLFQPDVAPDHVLAARVHQILDRVFQGVDDGDVRLLGGAWQHIDEVVSDEHVQDDDVDTIVSYLRIFVAETLRIYHRLDAESLDSDSEDDDDDDEEEWMEDNADDVDALSTLLHDERQGRAQLTHQNDEPDDGDEELESQARYCPHRHKRRRIVLDSDDEGDDEDEDKEQQHLHSRQSSQRGFDSKRSRKRRRVIMDSDDEDDDHGILHGQAERSSRSNTGDCPRSKRRRVVLDSDDRA